MKYVVVVQASDDISVALITKSLKKAKKKCEEIDDIENCQYAYVCKYNGEVASDNFSYK